MTKKNFLPHLRSLVECFQNFETLSSRNLKELNITVPQFDIIATLGNTDGMNCKELGEKTLITKGTLTGVLDRLENKGLIVRKFIEDRRCQKIILTEEGQKLFNILFEKHIQYLQPIFEEIGCENLEKLKQSCEASSIIFKKHLKGE